MYPEQQNINAYECIRVSLASPDKMRSWSKGEVTKPETINYRSLKPERDGLFCARIFGPVNDWECLCGKYKRQKFKGVTCDKCGVEVTKKSVRRERMGHIQLASPVSHVWFFKGVPSRIGYLLDIPLKDLERVLYFEAYAVTESGGTSLKEGEILNEDKFREYRSLHGEGFKAQMGAEAIKELLKQVDIEALTIELRDLMKKETSTQKRSKIAKRLKVAESFHRSGNKPEWMILDVVPVLPPELRPLVPLDGGRFATSDLNDLYRRVINRNNRLKKLLELKAPDVIVRNEKRMLQEAVDALFENGKRGRLLRGVSNRPLKSLSDALKGKQGRFRQNLLGKRVDYSGRSVIVVGPDLKLHQCGLPKKMALELFKPFIFNRLEHKGYAATIRQAKEMVEEGRPEVWDVLEEVIKDHPVLLNRAPTLHRLGIQAFQPVLVEGKAIRLHPLVCTAFNADFDGDQMAVHVPLSPMAQIEAKVLMMSTQNILNPANGRPNVVPSQDIVLGGYYLTKKRFGRKGEGMVFGNVNDVVAAYDAGVVDTHTIIQLRYTGEWVDTEAWHAKDPKKNSEQEVFEAPAETVKNAIKTTTVGRVLFNRALPAELPFINGLLKKEGLLSLVNRAYKLNGPEVTIRMLDAMKDSGFQWAMRAGVSVGIDDLVVPDTKGKLIKKATEDVRAIEKEAYEGRLDSSTRYNRILEVWGKTSDQVASDMMKELEKRNENDTFLNSIYILADSGARGSKTQIRQVAGMRGLMAKPSGDIIETPITANFKEGLSVLQYFISTHGARKGLADTALKTADSGYLTRKLVDVAQDVIVNEDDCETLGGIEVEAIVNSDGTIRSRLRDRIMGRVCLEDIVDPYDPTIVRAPAGTLISEDLAFKIETSGIPKVKIRSTLTCEARRGICAKCYGLNLSTGRLVDLGEAVGVIAAQSIGEPGTQLTMRTFHVGGAASRTSEKSTHEAQIAGVVKYEGLQGKTVVNRKGEIVALTRNGYLLVTDADGNERERYKITSGAILKVKDKETVEPRTVLAEWDPYNDVLLTEVGGIADFKEFEVNVSYQEEKDPISGNFRKKVIDPTDDKIHPHINIKGDNHKVLKRYNIPTGAYVEVEEGQELLPGDVIAKTSRQQAKTSDITGGLPRVTELFEGRKPKEPAIISEVTGIAKYGNRVRGNQKVVVEAETGEKGEYLIPRGKHIQVQDGDEIRAGEKLTEGAVSPHDLLKVQGDRALQAFLVNEVQEVYRAQGVVINDKHIEVIIRQMMRWVLITDVGDTPLIVEEKVDKHRFKEINEQALKDGGTPATCEPLLLGITKAALTSESFISAASFQETTRVLTEAALEGRVDYLRGLKENVILGRLIPAGTGMAHYRNLEIEEGEYPEPTLNEFQGGEDFDDEYARMAQHVEELQGMTEIDGEDL
ncbi:DNA-directed RNA polymerase subunit beta' [Geothrix oryzae]|jgi:DNA-directed RNA polymerase subunit beta'|uniref:DNA-directed RNA polymerase subunit beta' n=1 Tax=Geothrix oryzae TaxID=2927975 RepID=A0ABM8DTR4_9BACT|nr:MULTISPECIES: DNA-directed RNA polymerase subunit beta' [Geothrix]BDU70476.1 DNA-directed RNA polymerase subunit beta' [Geothrix oryzae]